LGGNSWDELMRDPEVNDTTMIHVRWHRILARTQAHLDDLKRGLK
jgi:hypothetical protein